MSSDELGTTPDPRRVINLDAAREAREDRERDFAAVLDSLDEIQRDLQRSLARLVDIRNWLAEQK